MDVRTITCSTNLVNEMSGLKAHTVLAPANATYARRQTMWGGKVRLRRRERFRTAKTMEIAAITDQKNLFSGWLSTRNFIIFWSGS